MSKLATALALAERSFKVFPIAAGAKAPPLVVGWPVHATDNAGVVRGMWENYPDANIGIHCEGLLVLDVDVKKDGIESMQFLDMTEGLPKTLTTITPSGGKHLFYRLPEGHPGCPNSVSVVGPGLDVRSTNGYVVAPGSTVQAGMYVFDEDVPIADAPLWLVERAGVATHKDPKPKVNVPDAPEATVEQALAWLRTAERSVKGQGGDQVAYRVACGLRDRGLSYAQACDAMRSDAWDHGCGWREGRLESKPIRSAYRYAQGDPGAKALVEADLPAFSEEEVVYHPKTVSEDDFGLVTTNLAEPAGAAPSGIIEPRKGPIRLDEFAQGGAVSQPYVIKGLLSRASYTVLHGQPGAGKTFVAFDMGYHVATGTPWHGRLVKQGAVLYLAYEGVGGLRKRTEALRRHYGRLDVPFYVLAASYNLREIEGRKALGADMALLPEVPSLIVIDTLAHALMGGDENSAQDVGAFNQAVQALIRATGACVMVIHHPPKNGEGPRGSGAIRGACDSEIQVANRTVMSMKQRDYELGDAMPFQLRPVPLGVDDDGDEITSCVVVPSQAAAQTFNAVKGLKGKYALAWQALCEKRPDNSPITETEWRQACEDFLPPHREKKDWYDIKIKLKLDKLITIDEDGLYSRRLE